MTLYAGSVKAATFPLVSQNITAAAQAMPIAVDESEAVVLQMVATSLVGHNSTFEGSVDSTNGTDGNWIPVWGLRTQANTLETATGVLAATPGYGWRINASGFSFIRVRTTAHTSGTAQWLAGRTTFPTLTQSAAPTVGGAVTVSGSLTSAGTTTNTPATPTTTNVNSAATTNGTVIKASAGTLYSLVMTNNNAAARFVRIYNSASVTVGTTTVAQCFALPATSGVVTVDFGALGLRCSTGICLSITGAAGDADTTAVTAGDTKVSATFI